MAAVVPRGLAERSGSLRVGDRVTMLNYVPAAAMSIEQIMVALEQDRAVCLELKRGDP